MNEVRTVELFAGVGGFRLGLEAASSAFKFVWANQWEPSMTDQYAFDCYTAHFGVVPEHVCKDIAKAKAMVPDHDLLVGGFPCQDYSIMKKNSEGITGRKGVLWWQIADILKEKRPKYVILENVDRLIRSPTKQFGRDFSIILRSFYENGYAVEWRIINAADYGCAQRRRRTFIVAYHSSTRIYKDFADKVCIYAVEAMKEQVRINGLFPKAFPIKTISKRYTEAWIDEMLFDSVSDIMERQRVYLYNAGVMMNGRIYSAEVQPLIIPAIPLKDILEIDDIDERYFLREEDMERWIYSKGPKHEIRHHKDGSEYYFSEGTVAFPDPLDKPSRTMVTSESQVGRSSHVVKDEKTGRSRTLTPVECERLNGFPDNWTDTGMPEKMRYFCMGNALVVPLIKRIGSIFIDFYCK